MCTKHYQRMRKTGSVCLRTPRDFFLEKVDKNGGVPSNGRASGRCWLWTGAISETGYGVLTVRYKRKYAHRIAYEYEFGEIPDGLVIDHLCSVRNCVNPAHLEATTQGDNLRRSDATLPSVNSRKTHCPHGHQYTDANTYYSRGKSGGQTRKCKACTIDRAKRRINDQEGVGS